MSNPQHRQRASMVCLVALATGLALISACSDSPMAPGDRSITTLMVAAKAPPLTVSNTLVLWVTAPDLKTPYGFNLPVVAGLASGALSIPMGSSRLFTALLYAPDGTETYRGSATVAVEAGFNPTLTFPLKARYGDPSVRVKLDITGATAGGTIQTKLTTATLVPGQTAQVTAGVFDANGKPAAGASLYYSSMNPAGAMIDSAGRISGLGNGTITILVAARWGNLVFGSSITMIKIKTYRFNWSDVSAGNQFSCGIRAWDNAAACWGRLNSVSLGSVPVLLNDGHAYAQISAGFAHVCGVTTTNQVFCWGDGSAGQLGNGVVGSSSTTPVAVQSSTPFTQVSAGAQHTCAVAVDQHVECWGDNSDGALGTSVMFRGQTAIPTSVEPPHGEHFLSISAGEDFTCGVTTAHGLLCWGQNAGGQLGIGNANPSFTDTPSGVVTSGVSASPILASLISAGYSNGGVSAPACAVGSAQLETFCWGDNSHNELGNGLLSPAINKPLQPFVLLPYLPVSLSTGLMTTCVTSTGFTLLNTPPAPPMDAMCWGQGTSGEIGNGMLVDQPQPSSVSRSNGYYKVSVGFNHACGIAILGTVYCWGQGRNGELGAGAAVVSSSLPVSVRTP